MQAIPWQASAGLPSPQRCRRKHARLQRPALWSLGGKTRCGGPRRTSQDRNSRCGTELGLDTTCEWVEHRRHPCPTSVLGIVRTGRPGVLDGAYTADLAFASNAGSRVCFNQALWK